ncbi:MAG TPA: amylo-alpha-1,6-glucosidase [Methylomirabilota bacterium]|nr:amylo-alpha-1,6-glucosidase [Methylomirabilota bacterium]
MDFGREVTGSLAVAESREWLCTNGLGGFASGTVAGLPTRRYHGLLVAALKPPVGRTVLVDGLHERIEYDGATYELSTARWADGAVAPAGYRLIERFYLDGTTPVWHYACADTLVEKRVWMEPGANTTYVRYRLLRAGAGGPVRLTLRALVNYREFHVTTHGPGWQMAVAPAGRGLQIIAYDGARPLSIQMPGATAEPAHDWYVGFRLAAEEARGLDALDDSLHAGTFTATLAPDRPLTAVLSAEARPDLDGEQAWARRRAHETEVLLAWRKAQPAAGLAPAWIERLVLAADQFVVSRPLADDPGGLSVIAGYHWFGDWGRDTMIALPGLTLCTGRPEAARRILTTFARFVDGGMLPNVFPDAGEQPEYNTVDAALWYVEAVRAYHEATRDDGALRQLFPALEQIVRAYAAGTRYGIRVDPADGLVTAGEPGVQLTWMDARVGDRVVTPRTGKPVEINALWYNALVAMAGLARALGRSATEWEAMAARAAAGFARFWNAEAGYCYDVIDGPDGHEAALRPNQILAVSLPATALSAERQRQIVDACARRLLISYGLRSLAPGEPGYQPRYAGGPRERDGAYHQGTAWAWLLGPFALAYDRVHGDRAGARALLEPMAQHLGEYGVGSIAEVFDAEPPFAPGGCIAQAWSVAETLRAWCLLAPRV